MSESLHEGGELHLLHGTLFIGGNQSVLEGTDTTNNSSDSTTAFSRWLRSIIRIFIPFFEKSAKNRQMSKFLYWIWHKVKQFAMPLKRNGSSQERGYSIPIKYCQYNCPKLIKLFYFREITCFAKMFVREIGLIYFREERFSWKRHSWKWIREIRRVTNYCGAEN